MIFDQEFENDICARCGLVIDEKNSNEDDQKIPSKNINQEIELRKKERKNNGSGSYKRNLSKALNEIDKYGSMMGFSKDMKEDSSIIYRNALDMGLIKDGALIKQ